MKDSIVISGKYQITFNPNNASLTSLKYEGKELLTSPLELNFWRVPLNNDEGAKLHRKWSSWRDLASKVKVINTRTTGNQVIFDLKLPGNSQAQLTYTIHDGVDVTLLLKPKKAGNADFLPRIGMSTSIPAEQNIWTWYGRGPHENYIDRKRSANVGIYSGKVADLFNLYLDPQEASNRCDIRWSTLTNATGTGIKIESIGKRRLEMTACPYSERNVELARHPVDLVPEKDITLHIDYGQTGVGGTNSWGQMPLPKYRLFAKGEYRYSFRITALSK